MVDTGLTGNCGLVVLLRQSFARQMLRKNVDYLKEYWYILAVGSLESLPRPPHTTAPGWSVFLDMFE